MHLSKFLYAVSICNCILSHSVCKFTYSVQRPFLGAGRLHSAQDGWGNQRWFPRWPYSPYKGTLFRYRLIWLLRHSCNPRCIFQRKIAIFWKKKVAIFYDFLVITSLGSSTSERLSSILSQFYLYEIAFNKIEISSQCITIYCSIILR